MAICASRFYAACARPPQRRISRCVQACARARPAYIDTAVVVRNAIEEEVAVDLRPQQDEVDHQQHELVLDIAVRESLAVVLGSWVSSPTTDGRPESGRADGTHGEGAHEGCRRVRPKRTHCVRRMLPLLNSRYRSGTACPHSTHVGMPPPRRACQC